MKKLLIANRGEIAVRIIRSARAEGWQTVAVYSDADRDALHVQSADEAVHLGPAPALESYLDQHKLLEAVRGSGATAVHPGYGFLSENAEFAELLEQEGVTFVGPSAAAIRAMGSKIEAKNTVAAAGTPVVPGYPGDDQAPAALAEQAEKVGFPLLIKASAGGGGKGMRLVEEASAFTDALASAKREAAAAFGDDRVLLERYLTAPKHIEVQILADQHGRTLHLFERDCSVQRRHQKVVEEAPAPGVDAALRARLGEAAVAAAESIGYTGAGTVEFIAEGGEFFFMEMNTRLQVEHPVTEAVTGIDLVAWQLRIAEGRPLDFDQSDLQLTGHAIEARVYAENPRKRFMPSTGRLHRARFSSESRVDAGVRSGDLVSMHYDPMLAKVICHGADREDALARLRAALKDVQIAGVAHNVGYVMRVLAAPNFVAGDYTTGFADEHHEHLTQLEELPFLVAAALALSGEGAARSPWSAGDGFSPNLPPNVSVQLEISKEDYSVQLAPGRVLVAETSVPLRIIQRAPDELSFELDGRNVSAAVLRVGSTLYVMIEGDTVSVTDIASDIDRYSVGEATGGGIVSPLPGQVLEMRVAVGDRVKAGQTIAIVEAMKMEHTVTAPSAGVISEVFFGAGSRVEEGAALVALED